MDESAEQNLADVAQMGNAGGYIRKQAKRASPRRTLQQAVTLHGLCFSSCPMVPCEFLLGLPFMVDCNLYVETNLFLLKLFLVMVFITTRSKLGQKLLPGSCGVAPTSRTMLF